MAKPKEVKIRRAGQVAQGPDLTQINKHISNPEVLTIAVGKLPHTVVLALGGYAMSRVISFTMSVTGDNIEGCIEVSKHFSNPASKKKHLKMLDTLQKALPWLKVEVV